jgi:E3 ubiquitin-protein ligase HERC3
MVKTFVRFMSVMFVPILLGSPQIYASSPTGNITAISNPKNVPFQNPIEPSRSVIQIASGGAHTCAILDNHDLKCWGDNSDGQLGLETLRVPCPPDSPSQCQPPFDNRGDQPGEMGDRLPPVNLGTGRIPLSISAGGAHTCALLDNHTVKCWGDNRFRQLGLGDMNNRGDEPGEMGDNLPPVNLGTGRTALSVVAGIVHTCALLDDHTVKCWGYNFEGALGLGDSNNRGDKPGEMGDGVAPVKPVQLADPIFS